MTPKEQEPLLAELENRIDRLRVLYDQYFLGFEKLEPTIPRKDVERRFAVIRKENIRNTALRFRLNVLTQKYNTYSMYWTRICRQIEEGTFRRHVRKAKKILEQGLERDRRDLDASIDVDMEDFEDADMDALLAEAEAPVAKYENMASDAGHLARPRGDEAGAARPYRPASPNPLFTPTPRTAFVVKRQREMLDEPSPPSPLGVPLGPTAAPMVSARAAAGPLPPGGAPKKLIRKKDGTLGSAEPSPPSPRAAPPASSPAPPSSPRPVAAPPAAPASSPRVALAPVPASSPRPQPMSAPRPAAAAPPAADQPPPQSQPTPPRSSPRMPGAPQSPRAALPAIPPQSVPDPAAAPAAPAGAASTRLPAAAPPSPPSVGRVAPPAPPSSPRVPPKPEDTEPRETRPRRSRPLLPSQLGKKSGG